MLNLVIYVVFAGKTSWPELVGYKGQEAVAIIKEENPHVDAFTILEGTIVTQEFKCDRVRVWVDENGKVVRVPKIG